MRGYDGDMFDDEGEPGPEPVPTRTTTYSSFEDSDYPTEAEYLAAEADLARKYDQEQG